MLLSMTGFGKGIAESSSKKYTIELKSLNSKQLDLSVRIPLAYREVELELRNRVAESMLRGKVEMMLSVENKGADTEVSLNVERASAMIEQMRQLGGKLQLAEPADWYSVLVRCPDIFRNDAPTAVDDEDKPVILEALTQALAGLKEFRAEEGKKLDAFFRKRIENIANLLSLVPQYEAERIVKIRARMEDALSKIPQADYDRNRYEQEMIFYIEKLDINEEKQRLTQHLNYFLQTLDAEPGQGKKLGFIAQEMGREINTLGSKSNHAEMQIIVVKMKDELEQIKEQVLNVL